MINKIFSYIFFTLIIGPGEASDPWSQEWLQVEDALTYRFNYTKTEGWSHQTLSNSSKLSLYWLGQEPCLSLSLTSLEGMLRLEH